ncbi:hypothetical protein HA466_0038610 [Hirschfeldia incana]|nr:hypothetical protein HA466_0038610 [Hirschfeldia incana]
MRTQLCLWCLMQKCLNLKNVSAVEARELMVSMFFTESPTNPFLRCVDIRLVSEIYKRGTFGGHNENFKFNETPSVEVQGMEASTSASASYTATAAVKEGGHNHHRQ